MSHETHEIPHRYHILMYLKQLSARTSTIRLNFTQRYGFPSPPSSRKSAGEMPQPSSSTEQEALPKSTLMSIRLAFASNAFSIRPNTTCDNDDIVVEDLIWAATSGGRALISAMNLSSRRDKVTRQHPSVPHFRSVSDYTLE